jgi:hypothetical protein
MFESIKRAGKVSFCNSLITISSAILMPEEFAYCPLRIAHCQLPIANCPLPLSLPHSPNKKNLSFGTHPCL